MRNLVRQAPDIKPRDTKLKTTIFISLLIFLVASCEKPLEKLLEKPLEKPSVEANKTLETPKAKVNTNTLNATSEDFDNEDIWDEPRLEFLRGEQNKMGVTEWHKFSVDLDGGNVRQIIAFDELSQNGKILPGRYLHRSPDNRYLAGNFSSDSESYIGLTDLHTKTHKLIVEARGPGRLAWSPDSSYIIFYGARGMYKYTLETGNLKFLTKTFSLQLYILPDHNIMAIEYPGVVFYDKHLKRLDSLEINHSPGGWFRSEIQFRISPSKRYLLAVGVKGCVYDLTLPPQKNQLYCNKTFSGDDFSFYSDSELVRNGYGEKFVIFNFKNNSVKEVKLPDDEMYSILLYSLINSDLKGFSLPRYPYLN